MKQTNPIVSVIVPIYNVEPYLQSCIDSIRIQTYSQLEIILVDDGSSDLCGTIADRNAQEDSRIVVIHKENGGLSSARNAGLDIAKGEYVSFIDSDDTIHPQFIEILLGLCNQYDCDISQCDYLTVADNSVRLPLNSQQSLFIYNGRQAIYQLCCTRNIAKFAIACNKLYKRKLFRNTRYPIGKYHEDEFTTYRLLWEAKKIIITNQYLYYYLQRETSITGKPFSVKRLDALEAFKERLKFLKVNKLEQEYMCTLHFLYNLMYMDYLSLKENVKNCENICTNLRKDMQTIEKILNEPISLEKQMARSCIYPQNSKIVLYGAGKWGDIFYKWILKKQYGTIVGWVDNDWSNVSKKGYNIRPLDALLKIEFDYVLITIKEKSVQEEVRQNLISWGISEEKILSIYIDE